MEGRHFCSTLSISAAPALRLRIGGACQPASFSRLMSVAGTRLNDYSMTFDGALLERGFWLYVWRIIEGTRTVLYVGRTGDSSSPNASSPF